MANVIVTQRLRLRKATWDDLEPIHAVMSTPNAMRYWSTLPHESLDVTRGWFPCALLDHDNPNMDEWVLELNGVVVGYMGIWKMPEFGFILYPLHWGKGLASEAASALIPRLFATHSTDQLTADVDPRNIASLTLLRKLGFVETDSAKNTFLLGDKWCDSTYLSLSRKHAKRFVSP